MPDEERSEVRRRILDVDVNEVSLVDRAANLRRFLVVKRNDEEDKKMGAFKSDEAVEKAKKPDEEEEMKAKAKAAEEEEEEKKKAADEKAKAEAEEEEKKKAMNPSAIAGMLRGLKGAPKEVKAVIDWLDSKKAEKQDEEEEDYPSPKAKAKTKKSVDEGDLPAVQVMQDGSVIVSGQPVHKGKKFTASRTSAIKDVTMTLLKLIGEVDPDTMKSIEEALKELPKDPKWNQGVKATGTGDSVKLGKQEEEEDEEKAALKKEVADLKKRLEKIEEERPVSKSIDEEGGTEKKKVEKSDGVSWKGII